MGLLSKIAESLPKLPIIGRAKPAAAALPAEVKQFKAAIDPAKVKEALGELPRDTVTIRKSEPSFAELIANRAPTYLEKRTALLEGLKSAPYGEKLATALTKVLESDGKDAAAIVEMAKHTRGARPVADAFKDLVNGLKTLEVPVQTRRDIYTAYAKELETHFKSTGYAEDVLNTLKKLDETGNF
jgi:hypothetical protein